MRIGNIDARGQAVFDDALNTASQPAISFDGDTDTGFYRGAADTLDFATGGGNRLTINNTVAAFGVIIEGTGGTAAAPSFTFTGDADTGLYSDTADTLCITTGGTMLVCFDTAVTVGSAVNVVMSGGGTVQGLPSVPTLGTDAASKDYVDSVAAGLDPKESVRAATTANPGGTYSPTGGTAGTGAFTAIDLTTNFDGVSLIVGDRVLIKDSAATQNGIYVVTIAGASGAIERASDHDGTPANEVSAGNHTFVEQGSTYADTGWVLTGDGILTLNTDAITWTQFTGAGSFTAGLGIGQSGSTIFLNSDELATATIDGADTIAFFDGSATPTATDPGMRKTTLDSLFTTLNVLTNATGNNALLASDGVRIFDSGTTAQIELDITNLGAATITGADELVFDDGASGTHAKTTVTNFLADLDIVNGLAGNGFAVQTAADTYTARSITVAGAGNADGLSVTNGDGVAGDPVLGLDIVGNVLAGENAATGDLFLAYNLSATANQAFTLAELSAGVVAEQSLFFYNSIAGDSGTATAAAASETLNLVGAASGGITTTAADGAPDSVTFGLTPVDLATGAATLAGGDFIVVSDSADTATTLAQKYTFDDMLDDLDIVHGITTNGITVRTAADTYTSRSIAASVVAGDEGISVVNGDGVAGNPTIGVDITGQAASADEMNGTDEFLGFDGTNNVKFTGQQIADGVATLISLSPTTMNDADGDTAIHVEEAADEDIIRFDTGDTPAGYGAVADIMTLASSGWTVAMGTANVAATAGAPISFTSGTGNTSGNGGDITFTGGDGGTTDTSKGGSINLTGGTSTATNGDGGDICLTPGAGTGTGTDGVVKIVGPTSGTAGTLRLEDNDGSNYIEIQAAGTIASNFTLTLPATDSTGTQALVSDGAGTLSWSDIASTAFTSVTGDTGTATADTASDTIALTGATNGGIVTVASDTPDGVTFAMDINDLTTAAVASGDFVAFADISDANNTRKVTVADLATAIQGETSLGELSDVDTSAQAAGFALIYDAAAGAWEAKKIYHTETFASATQWVVTHSLNAQFVNVTVYDNAGVVVIPATITATSATVTTIDFAVATAGDVAIMGVEVI